jgi:hypothetical protein
VPVEIRTYYLPRTGQVVCHETGVLFSVEACPVQTALGRSQPPFGWYCEILAHRVKAAGADHSSPRSAEFKNARRRGNALDLCSGGARFGFRPGDRPPILRIFVVLPSLSKQLSG